MQDQQSCTTQLIRNATRNNGFFFLPEIMLIYRQTYIVSRFVFIVYIYILRILIMSILFSQFKQQLCDDIYTTNTLEMLNNHYTYFQSITQMRSDWPYYNSQTIVMCRENRTKRPSTILVFYCIYISGKPQPTPLSKLSNTCTVQISASASMLCAWIRCIYSAYSTALLFIKWMSSFIISLPLKMRWCANIYASPMKEKQTTHERRPQCPRRV